MLRESARGRADIILDRCIHYAPYGSLPGVELICSRCQSNRSEARGYRGSTAHPLSRALHARQGTRRAASRGIHGGALVSRSNVVFGPFYGYPSELVAEWCGVSVRTATRWKTGQSRPPPSALKLFLLHRERRVLGKEWAGWLINQNTLVDPEGQSTTQGQLRAYAHVYALCRELARRDKDAVALLDRLIAMAG